MQGTTNEGKRFCASGGGAHARNEGLVAPAAAAGVAAEGRRQSSASRDSKRCRRFTASTRCCRRANYAIE